MKNLKKGDTVTCLDDSGFKKMELSIHPESKRDYVVRSVSGNYLVLEGFYGLDEWHVRYFEKKQPEWANRKLAEQFVANETIERPEYERVFSLTAKF